MNRLRTKKDWLLLLGIGCCVTVLTAWSILHFAGTGEKDAERLRRDIKANLPPGSSRADAESWFAARGLQPHTYKNRDGQGEELIVVLDKTYFLDWNGKLIISFEFDEDDKLIERVIHWHPNCF